MTQLNERFVERTIKHEHLSHSKRMQRSNKNALVQNSGAKLTLKREPKSCDDCKDKDNNNRHLQPTPVLITTI